MVFLSLLNFAKSRGPDKFWRTQQFLRFSALFYGRRRNCYRIGMRYVFKALSNSRKSNFLKKQQMKLLWNRRIEAAAQEHGFGARDMMEGLARTNIQLDRKMLVELSIYEPRTFQSLTEVSKKCLEEQGIVQITGNRGST